jgi:hypothetical protein
MGGMPAAGGGGAESEPPAMPQAPVVGNHLLFWGDAAVKYPVVGDALIRSERLREANYLVTGKLSLRNPSEATLDLTCNVTLAQCINIEHVSVAPGERCVPRDDVRGFHRPDRRPATRHAHVQLCERRCVQWAQLRSLGILAPGHRR